MFLDTPASDPSHPAPLVERLDRETCLALLATESVGRLAVSRAGEAPHVVPVNYTIVRNAIVFRSSPGTKLQRLITEPVTFEVDAYDIESRTGWSVVAQGFAYEASDREMAYEDVDLDCFLEQQNSRCVCLQPNSLTGRRILRPAVRSRTSVPSDRDVRL